jgi:hypothetical protein
MCKGLVWVFGSVSISLEEASAHAAPSYSTIQENIFNVWGSSEDLSPVRLVARFVTT